MESLKKEHLMMSHQGSCGVLLLHWHQGEFVQALKCVVNSSGEDALWAEAHRNPEDGFIDKSSVH